LVLEGLIAIDGYVVHFNSQQYQGRIHNE
jgi:hypothetical protein